MMIDMNKEVVLSLSDLKALVIECEDECENAEAKGADDKISKGCHSQIRIPLSRQLPENKSDPVLERCIVCGRYFAHDLQRHVALFQKALTGLKAVGKGLSIQLTAQGDGQSQPSQY
jgi:hypothetical protein